MWANKLRLKKKLYSMKLKHGESLQDHLKAFIEIYEELTIVGEAMNDEDRVIHLLASVPDSYSSLVTTCTGRVG